MPTGDAIYSLKNLTPKRSNSWWGKAIFPSFNACTIANFNLHSMWVAQILFSCNSWSCLIDLVYLVTNKHFFLNAHHNFYLCFRCAGNEHFILKIVKDLPNMELIINTFDWPKVACFRCFIGPTDLLSRLCKYHILF